MRDAVKIAAVQMEPKIMQTGHNLENIVLDTKKAAASNADLAIFPECSLTGYMFSSLEEALPYMETVPGPATEILSALSRELGIYIIAGLLEASGGNYFNTAVLTGPEGLAGKYRKAHLPYLGIDRFLDPGDQPFEVYKTEIGNIGIHICYDCNFPECARVMTLLGADIIALPTNWPKGREIIPGHVVVCRAYENKVNLAAANRVGIERGTEFIGMSRIVNSCGDVIAAADGKGEQIIYGDISLSETREKDMILKAGEFEINFIRDRRPELYKGITEKSRDI
jgi:predicted amidohydrolase